MAEPERPRRSLLSLLIPTPWHINMSLGFFRYIVAGSLFVLLSLIIGADFWATINHNSAAAAEWFGTSFATVATLFGSVLGYYFGREDRDRTRSNDGFDGASRKGNGDENPHQS